jgi:hypothetical protein
MFKYHPLAAALLAAALLPAPAMAADSDLQQLRAEVERLRAGYAAQMSALEARLKKAEEATAAAQANAAQARETAQQVAAAPAAAAPVATPAASAGAFNPGVSLILSGQYGNLSKDPQKYRIANFAKGGEAGPVSRGFGLSESELGLSANIDQLFYGQANFAISSDNEVSAEEAFVQTTALPAGFTIKGGRFFSGIGYLNEQHAHTWDFVDAPLAYQAFLGNQFSQDGVQLRWLAPTSTFIELGSELGKGNRFPGTDSSRNGAGARAVFAHVGGDVGLSNSWRAGVSWLRMQPQNRSADDIDLNGASVSNSFTGSSRLLVGDFIWKWAPNGNGERTNLKLQGEYFRRHEAGSLTYDTAATASAGDYRSAQSGWYVQSVYQFMPAWRVGARYDRLDSGRVDYGSNSAALGATSFSPNKRSLMIDWSPSEFSRLRLQFARDKSVDEVADRQIVLQYQMSLGAHGAHSY